MPKVIVRGGKGEYAGRVREIMQEKKNVRVKLHLSFYDPETQTYKLMAGQTITFDVDSVTFVLNLKEKLEKYLFPEG